MAMISINKGREALLRSFEEKERLWRSSKFSQFIRAPLIITISSLLGRVSNLFFGGKLILTVNARTFFGEKITIPVPLYADIWKYGAFLLTDPEIRLTKFILRNIDDGAVFFDVGAHIGYYSLLVASISKDSKTFAFEPDPKILRYLVKNRRNNITIIDKAVTDKDGPIKFYSRHQAASWVSTAEIENFAPTKEKDIPFDIVEVESITLGSFCKSHNINPTYIKIDVEGAEEKVLKGAADILDDGGLCIAVEIRFEPLSDNYKNAVKILCDFGFDVYSIGEDGALRKLDTSRLPDYFSVLKRRYLKLGDTSNFDNLIFIK